MKIDDALRAKLAYAVEQSGGAGAFARRSGINAANISRYLRGVIRSINDDNWEKLAPFIESGTIPDIEGEQADIIRSTPELSAFIAEKMKLAHIRNAELLRRKINCGSYELLRRQLSGKLNWFADTLCRVLDVLGVNSAELPVSEAERKLLENAELKRRDICIMRNIPIICGMEEGTPEISGEFQVPLEDTRDLRAFRVSGDQMFPLLAANDIAVFEVVSNFSLIPENAVTAVRFSARGNNGEKIFFRRWHRISGSRVVLSCDNPSYGIDAVVESDIVWCALMRLRISEFL